MKKRTQFLTLIVLSLIQISNAAVLMYGDQDLLGTGTYSSDPTAGATLSGLAPGVVTYSTLITGHGFPFAPSVGDYPGTDQIYVGSIQTGAHDGYSTSAPRLNGPQVIALDYSSLVSGSQVGTLTLGIAADDFQNAVFGQPFTARINGVINPALTAALNGLDQSGPVTQFLTVGIDPTSLTPKNILTLTIDEAGDGGDGWAVDYLTIGVTAVPEPSAVALVAVAGLTLFSARRKQSRARW